MRSAESTGAGVIHARSNQDSHAVRRFQPILADDILDRRRQDMACLAGFVLPTFDDATRNSFRFDPGTEAQRLNEIGIGITVYRKYG